MLTIFSIISITIHSEDSNKNQSSNNYNYTSIGFHFTESEKSGFAINLSLGLPADFYIVLQRKADGIDYKTESYDKVIDTLRLGVHKGIGDLIGNVSVGDFNFKLKNLFDVFVEAGIKTSEFDGERFNFENDGTYASYLAGIRFGNSNKFEGKLFLDMSKEATIIDSSNPTCIASNCLTFNTKLSNDSDKKFGIGILYNINTRNAFSMEISSSKVQDNMLQIGYQFKL